MCGIAGIIAAGHSSPPVDRMELERMSVAMVQRGPDGSGRWLSTDGRVGFIHRRLSIIDLSEAGAQPMVDPETGCVITFNGEIYNFKEIRSSLEERGHRFRGHSDTEVILRSYVEFGTSFLPSLRGMFAIAIWDPRIGKGLLARDPFGIKPLYVSERNGVIRFASQVKALVAGRGPIDTGIEPAAEVGFMMWGYVPAPFTTCRGIRTLPAGSFAVVDSKGLATPIQYWSLREEFRRSEALTGTRVAASDVDALGSALNDSVQHHLIADVPVGVFLSAGIDSTSIAALAARARAPHPVQTVTLAFEEFRDSSQDEAPTAEQLAKLLGTSHRTVKVLPGDFEGEFARALEAMDQPTVDGINTYFVSKAAHDAGLKVVLSGLGGDELLGGYRHFGSMPRHVALTKAMAGLPALGRTIRRASTFAWKTVGKPKGAGLVEYGGDIASSYMLHRCVFMPWELAEFLEPETLKAGLESLNTLVRLRSEIDGIRSQSLQISVLEMGNYMRDQLLRDSDWASMAHSLELRVPLVDTQLLRRVLALRAAGADCSKAAACRSASEAAFQLIAGRKKSGFGIPVAAWMKRIGLQVPAVGHPMRAWSMLIMRHAFKDSASIRSTCAR